MPRRARRAYGRTPTLHASVREFFEVGYCRRVRFFPAGVGLPANHDAADEALRALWAEHRATLLPAWIDARPGTRPGAWWLYDAPAARVIVESHGQRPDPDYSPPVCGVPTRWVPDAIPVDADRVPWWEFQPIGLEFRVDPDRPPVVEAQATFLRRLRLLDRDEAARLTSDAFTPWVVGPAAQEPSWAPQVREIERRCGRAAR